MIDDERSEFGSPIYRHEEREADFQVPEQSCLHLDQITSHIEKHLGEVKTVFHELISDLIHLDVLYIPPNESHPVQTLITSGVSDLPMNVPPGVEELNRIELVINLPPDWPVDQKSMENENHYWPIRWLKQLGRLPHEYNTWLGWGHTIPNGDPPEPIANTDFIGFMVSPPFWIDPDFFQLRIDDQTQITFYNLVPLYAEEMALKLKKGAEILEECLRKEELDFVINPRRKNVAKKRGWFS